MPVDIMTASFASWRRTLRTQLLHFVRILAAAQMPEQLLDKTASKDNSKDDDKKQ